jgi:hypothetical protein
MSWTDSQKFILYVYTVVVQRCVFTVSFPVFFISCILVTSCFFLFTYFLLSHMYTMKKYHDHEKNLHWDCTPAYEKVVLEFCLSVLMSVYMCTSLVPEWLDEFCLYLMFNSLSITGQCPVKMNILTPKIVTLHRTPKIQLWFSWKLL